MTSSVVLVSTVISNSSTKNRFGPSVMKCMAASFICVCPFLCCCAQAGAAHTPPARISLRNTHLEAFQEIPETQYKDGDILDSSPRSPYTHIQSRQYYFFNQGIS